MINLLFDLLFDLFCYTGWFFAGYMFRETRDLMRQKKELKEKKKELQSSDSE